MALRPLFNIETSLIWYSYHSVMVLRPLKYDVTTILTLSSLNYQYGTTTTQIRWYYHFDFLISPQIEKYWKNIYIQLRSFLISTGHYCSKRGCDFKNTLYSEGTYIIEGTMFLRPFFIRMDVNTFISEGTEKEDEEKNSLSTQDGGKKERVIDN